MDEFFAAPRIVATLKKFVCSILDFLIDRQVSFVSTRLALIYFDIQMGPFVAEHAYVCKIQVMAISQRSMILLEFVF